MFQKIIFKTDMNKVTKLSALYLDGGEADHSSGNALRNSVQLNCGSSDQPQRSLYQHSVLRLKFCSLSIF
jgi:hypothetical protein